MKHLVLIALTIFLTTIASAKCGYDGIWCINKSATLNKNGLIILNFYSHSQPVVAELNKKHPVWLNSSGDKVKLEVIQIYQGEWKETQVVLKPVAALKVNETYILTIDNVETKPERYDNSLHRYEPVKFTISNTMDNEIPVFASLPTVKKKTEHGGKCVGFGSWVHFNINGQDRSELFVKASVKNLTTGKTTSYILNIIDGETKVGGGICESDAFKLENSDQFEVVFQLMDESGNKSAVTLGIVFTKPTYENVAREEFGGKSIADIKKEQQLKDSIPGQSLNE